eukprot:TRINITY_DN4169_c0_g3_i3.p1 TRINITY_DN4169_c0_g3~~TRINITY_DN4169_c0_g3_i3.p1  ORF type:complete len:340 (+),score=26.99 TRINITY_DN4169_c0_g3_i3:75-1094(+)
MSCCSSSKSIAYSDLSTALNVILQAESAAVSQNNISFTRETDLLKYTTESNAKVSRIIEILAKAFSGFDYGERQSPSEAALAWCCEFSSESNPCPLLKEKDLDNIRNKYGDLTRLSSATLLNEHRERLFYSLLGFTVCQYGVFPKGGVVISASKNNEIVGALILRYYPNGIRRGVCTSIKEEMYWPMTLGMNCGSKLGLKKYYTDSKFCAFADGKCQSAIMSRGDIFDKCCKQWKKDAGLCESKPVLYVSAVGVDPSCQKSGIGGALLRIAIKLADEMKCTAWLECADGFRVGVYEKYGFKVAARGELKDAGVKNSQIKVQDDNNGPTSVKLAGMIRTV